MEHRDGGWTGARGQWLCGWGGLIFAAGLFAGCAAPQARQVTGDRSSEVRDAEDGAGQEAESRPPVASPAASPPPRQDAHAESPHAIAGPSPAAAPEAEAPSAATARMPRRAAPRSRPSREGGRMSRSAPPPRLERALRDVAVSGSSAQMRLGVIGHGAGGGGMGTGYGRGVGAMGIAGSLSAVQGGGFQTEDYAHNPDRPFEQVDDTPLSTFSVDVDTASYANVRRMLREGQRPPADAVRIEELLNYFDYDYPAPRGEAPFSVYTEVAAAPWNPAHRLVHIGLRGRDIADGKVPARNLVFLLDVSGSMGSPDKLPLLQRGLSMLVERLRAQDRVAIVVYAGASGVVLEPTPGDRRAEILSALQRLRAGGSTNGAGGIRKAYALAQAHFRRGGINRVILATDGDFNVGVSSRGELTRLIEEKRKSGVALTVLGFGRGNLKDSTMELLADKGNGNYAYIDSIDEAHKVLVREAGSTLVTIAKDLKLQIEWNPAQVVAYRLIGYENRVLAARDFNDDRKDAGEVGAGHTVTALYEVVIRGAADLDPVAADGADVDPLKYQGGRAPTAAASSDELLTVKLRYKQPGGERSKLLSRVVTDSGHALPQSSDDFRFAAAVAGFGMLLRGSKQRGDSSWALVTELAQRSLGRDPHGDRRGLLELVERAQALGI